MFRRLIDLVATTARQAVPVGGIFALGRQPPVAIAVYWFESMLLAAVAALLCVRLRDHTSGTPPDGAYASGLNPRDVLGFHWGSLTLFGLFFAAILFIRTMNGRVAPSTGPSCATPPPAWWSCCSWASASRPCCCRRPLSPPSRPASTGWPSG